jgi:hypothetical protein
MRPEPVIKWRSDGKYRGQLTGRCYSEDAVEDRGGEKWGTGGGEKPEFDFGKEKK